MYKDVCKRIWAMVLAVCMVVTLVQWPETVMAAEAKNYHTYQHGAGSTSGYIGESMAAAVFTVGKSSSGASEILDSVSFQAHKNKEDATARVTFYSNPQDGNPSSGTFIQSVPMTSLSEGQNAVEVNMTSNAFAAGTKIAVVVELQGASLAYYGGASAGQTYIYSNGSWVDASANSQCIAIRAYTYDVGDTGEEAQPWLEQLISSFSLDDDTDNSNISTYATSIAQLNKTNMTVSVDGYGDITLNDPDGTVSWSVGDTSIAQIAKTGDNTARVKGLLAGTTTIVASCEGNTYTCTLKVTSSVLDADVTMDPTAVVYDSNRHYPITTVKIGETKLEANTDYQLLCVSVDALGVEGATISLSDASAFINAGIYRFKIVGQGQYTGVRTVDYVISPKDITDGSVQVEIGTWDPADKTGYITSVTDTATGADLLTTGGCTVEVSENEYGEAGLLITGQGNYTGTRFCVTPKSVADAQITLDQSAYVYTGRDWQPIVTVAVGGYVLSASEYTVSYSSNKNVGTASVTVTGQNGYYDSQTVNFEILQKDVSNADQDLIQSPVEAVVSNSVGGADPEVAVTFNGLTLTEGTDYTLSFSVTDSTGICTITGMGNFKGTRLVNYTVASGDITAVADSIGFTESGLSTLSLSYTGSALEPKVVLMSGSNVYDQLVEGTHYEVIYANNINAGTATVTVKGIGAYGGKLTGTFTITAADFASTTAPFSYQFKNASGSAVSTTNYKVAYSLNADDMKPGVIVKNAEGKVLTEGTDYKLVYSVDTTGVDADLTGGLTVTVEPADGNTNYTNSKVLTYSITRCNISTAIDNGEIILTLDKDAFNYTGSPQVPEVTLKYATGEELVEGRDYTVAPEAASAPSAAGDYKVTITGAGNYMGYVEKAYKINGINVNNIENITPVDDVDSYKDNGGLWFAMKWFDDSNSANNKLALTIIDNNGNTLVEGTDYTLSYENIDAVSTSSKFAKVTITGRGTYTDSRTIYYLLAGKLEDYSVSIDDETLVYTGEKITLKEENVTISTGILWWKEELEQDVDYKLVYSNNVNAGQAEFVVEEIGDAKLPTENGCYRYSDGITDAQKLKGDFPIKPKDIGDETAITLKNAIVEEYLGTDIILTEDDIALVYNGKDLTDADFAIVSGSHVNNDAPSNDASVAISGKGNFTGTRVISFVITGKALTNLEAEVEEAIYTGEKLYPEITSLVTKDGRTLVKDTDYTYDTSDYADNKDAGTATITIHGLNEYLGSTAEIEFEIQPRDITATGGTCTVEMDGDTNFVYTSQEIRPAVVVKYLVSGANTSARMTLVEGTDYDLTYRDNVDCTTDAAIVITGKGNFAGVLEKTFEIKAKSIADTEDDVVVAAIPSQPYNGGIAVTPIPDIAYTYGSANADVYRLTSDDYTLAYTGQNKVGTATITITGQGNFTGSRTVNYHIGSAITDSNITISCPKVENGAVFTYGGSTYQHKPEVTVVSSKTGALELNKDYTVTYTDNINVGTATVTVEGIGSYAGVKEFTFEIQPKSIAEADVAIKIGGVADGSYQASYTGSPIEPEVVLEYAGEEVTTGYTVTYAGTHTNKGYVNVVVTAMANTNFTGTKNIQNTTAARYEITAASIGSGALADGYTMDAVDAQPLGSTGMATPTPKLYRNGVALVAGTDYTYSYENNKAIGTEAVVVMTGIGNYTGTVRQRFEIRGSIEGATVTVPSSIDYDALVVENDDGTVTLPTAITFDDEIVVTVNGVELVQGTDYDVSYTNNTWVGTATVSIKGKGSYAGLITKKVPIVADMAKADVLVGEQKYTGSAVKVSPIVEYYGQVLTEGVHYVIHTYSNNVEMTDSATVTIMGIQENGFRNTATATFSIVADAGALEVSGVANSYMYRGVAIEPAVVVKYGSKVLTAKDYEVTYGTNTNAGYGSIVVKGIGDYDGLLSENIRFDIVAQDINNLTVLDGKSNVIAAREYTGLAILPELGLTAKIGTTTFTMPTTDYTVTATTQNTEVGTVTLLIEGTGNVTGSRQVTFEIKAKSLSKPTSGTDTITVKVLEDTFAYDGTAKEPNVSVTYQYGDETQVRILEKDKDYVVSYNNNVAAGTASVIVTGVGNYTGSRTEKFSITAQDIGVATVTLPQGTLYTYMGSTVGVEPEVEVTVKGVTLTKDKDYTISYQNNKACGTATVTVTGKGDFSGTTATTFTITAHSINDADVIVADIPNQAYTGSPVVPELTITCGQYKLVKGVDYELTCTGNIEIGQAAVTIKGINGFKDSRMEIFRIASSIEQAVVSGLKDSYAYTGQVLTEDELGITEVKIGDTVLTKDDYEVTFEYGCDGKSVGAQTVVLNGTGEYGGSKKFVIAITAKDITDADVVMTGFKDSVSYADALMQNITLTWGSITLQKGTDYDVTCSPSSTEDVYVMTVTGKGNYVGTIEKRYTVEQAAVDQLEIKGISSSYTYTGAAIEPKPTVTLAGIALKEGTDYTLAYVNNVDAGVATMCVTGTGTTFSGEKEVAFTILRRSINHSAFDDIPTQLYTGKDIEPVVTVTDEGNVLAESTDYTLMYRNNRRTGTGTVVVAGKGNYTSTKTIPFSIRPCDVSSVTVTGASGTTVSLAWKGDGVVTGYEIYRAGADGKWQLVGGTRDTTYTDAKLSAGTSYTYKVRAYVVEDNQTYYGEFSAVGSATTTK